MPPGARDLFRRVVGSWGNEDLIENAFDLQEYDPSKEIEIWADPVRFQAAPHSPDVRDEHQLGERLGRIVYGADSSPTEALESSPVRRPDAGGGHAPAPGAHRDAGTPLRPPRPAGTPAERARSSFCSCTSPDELDWQWARDQAAEAFGGPVDVAREGMVYEV